MSITDTNEPTEEELATASQPAVAPLRMDVGRGEAPWVVTDDASYAKVPFGKRYTAPDGGVRQKAYEVTDQRTYDAVPDGATYVDPEGNERKKPTYEGIGYQAQTLYDMAINAPEKRKVLESRFPGKVVEDGTELYINDDGVLRKPGKGPMRDLAFLSSAAAPTVLSGLGAIGAGPWGAVGGAVAGQGINDLIMAWTGNTERTIPEQAGNMATGAMMSVAGYGVGKGLGAIAPTLAGAGKSIKDAGPIMAANVLGAGPEVTMARQIAERTEKPSSNPMLRKMGITETDTPVGASAWAHEAPYLQMLDEVYYPKFFTNQPHVRAAEKNYQRGVGEITGREVDNIDDLLKPREAVPTKEAGERLRARADVAQKSLADELERGLTQHEAELRAGIPTATNTTNAIQRNLQQQRQQAQQIVDRRLAAVEPDVNNAIQAAANGTNSGDFWGAVGGRLQEARREIGTEATRQYNAANRLAGGHRINAEPLSNAAIDFLEQAPSQLREQVNHPVIRRLRQIAGEQDPKTGAWTTQHTPLSLEELQDVRTWLRSMADYDDLPSSFKNGAVKHFARQADDLIQAAGRTPQLAPAVQALNAADGWYRQNIAQFNSTEMKAVIRGLRAGQPADPEVLYKTLVKPGHTEAIGQFEQVLGPNLWNGVRGAQRQSWVNKARSGNFDDAIDASKYADEVLDAAQNGTLFAVQGREQGQRMLQEARQIAMLDGRLDVNFAPGDTSFDIFRRARQAQLEMDQFAKSDPLGAAEKEIKQALDAQRRGNADRLARRDDPLGFVYEPTYGAQRAVDTILRDEDLILAAVARWGEKSPEFEGLRRVYIDRLFRDSMDVGSKLAKIKPEVQQIMLPGVQLETAKRIADEMALMLGAKGADDFGGSLAATAKVTNPIGGGVVGRTVQKIPLSAMAARTARAKYYEFMHKMVASPATLRYIERGLMGRDPAQLQRAREIMAASIQRGKTMGAMGAQGAYQGMDTEPTPQNTRRQPQ